MQTLDIHRPDCPIFSSSRWSRHFPASAQVRRFDQRAISTVAGNTSAVTYASLGTALDAVTYGVGVALLIIYGV